MATNNDQIEKLIEGELSWQELRNDVLPDPKDQERFETTRAVLQSSVDWDDPILVPLNDHLYVVGTDEGRKVKADCGAVLCDAEENWKMHTDVRVREDSDELEELYTTWMSPDEDWTFQLREFFCPNCYEQLDVEAVPAGYPILQKFEPDIDTFYEDWQNEPAPDKR
jgi:Acetone carboxylase, gamma subunit